MRSFLVLFDTLPIDKTSVKRGENSPQVVTAVRCVNVGLFLSNALRRDVDVILGVEKEEELRTIMFPGETLRRVSPDERSIAFFLLKATAELEQLSENTEHVMDSGIVVKRSSFESMISQWPYGQVFAASNDSISSISDIKTSDGIFIYSIKDEILSNLSKYGFLKRPRTPERFILDVNIHFDKKNSP